MKNASVQHAVMLLLLGGMSAAAWAGPQQVINNCIRTDRIESSKYVDDKTILLEMRGKAQVRMELKNRCPGLRFDPFAYESRGGRLCGGFDRIEVVRSGSFCQIDKFVEVEAKAETEESDTAQ